MHFKYLAVLQLLSLTLAAPIPDPALNAGGISHCNAQGICVANKREPEPVPEPEPEAALNAGGFNKCNAQGVCLAN